MTEYRDMSLDQLRLMAHQSRTDALAIQLAAGKRWGAKSALATAAGLTVKQADGMLRVIDDLNHRGEA